MSKNEGYHDYCMEFSNEELKLFCERFDQKLNFNMTYLSENGDKIPLEGDTRIETIIFDEEENVFITFWGHKTSIFVYNMEIWFIDESCKGTYTSSDVYGNAVYAGSLREMSYKQMLEMFSEIVLCFVDASDAHLMQSDVHTEKAYKKYNYFDNHVFTIDVENVHEEKQIKVFENITIRY